jgi:hypothetical protein
VLIVKQKLKLVELRNDTYVVEVSPAAVDPLRSLAVATCLVIDVVMKQKDYDN